MSKVQITYFGKPVSVDDDMVRLLLQKESLVKLCVTLQDQSKNATGVAKQLLLDQLTVSIGKIRRLNKKIRKNVQFL